MRNLQVQMRDPTLIRRFEQIQQGRGHKKASQTVRELAMERLAQIEQGGDPAAIPGGMGELMHTGDITRDTSRTPKRRQRAPS